jgi:predicted TIM-barrel fold metal-dependent hydrolase
MLEAIRKHDRLRATIIVDPEIDPYLLRMMKDAGVVGVRLQFRDVGSPPDLSSYPYRKLLRRVADLDWHVHLHDEGDRLPEYIGQIENAGPRLVIDHFGRPPAPDGIASKGFQHVLRSVERGNTWVKLSGAFRLKESGKSPAFAAALLKYAGPERLLWGSDWPFAAFEDSMTYAKVIDQFRRDVPNLSDRKAIDRTAYDFYFR